MDPKVLRLSSPDECEIFAANAAERGRVDLAFQAKRRAIELRASDYGAKTRVEKECLEAVYAYEEALLLKHGKRVRAQRTWQVIESKGVIKAVDDMVSHADVTDGFRALEKMGLMECAFEAVVLRHPEHFSAKAVEHSQARLKNSFSKS
jgi:hypothetical protein